MKGLAGAKGEVGLGACFWWYASRAPESRQPTTLHNIENESPSQASWHHAFGHLKLNSYRRLIAASYTTLFLAFLILCIFALLVT
jgi:hypothetical protein